MWTPLGRRVYRAVRHDAVSAVDGDTITLLSLAWYRGVSGRLDENSTGDWVRFPVLSPLDEAAVLPMFPIEQARAIEARLRSSLDRAELLSVVCVAYSLAVTAWRSTIWTSRSCACGPVIGWRRWQWRSSCCSAPLRRSTLE